MKKMNRAIRELPQLIFCNALMFCCFILLYRSETGVWAAMAWLKGFGAATAAICVYQLYLYRKSKNKGRRPVLRCSYEYRGRRMH